MQVSKIVTPEGKLNGHILEPITSIFLDEPCVVSTLSVFTETLDKRIATLTRLVEAENFEKIQLETHTLKGSAAAYGFPELAHKAQQMEESSKLPNSKPILMRDIEELEILQQRVLLGRTS